MRPENIERMIPWKVWPRNVWLGTTIENQEAADKRLPHLLKHKAAVNFVCCTPLLGEIDLAQWIDHRKLHSIDWIIAGGESGQYGRAMNPQWARKLRDFCSNNGIPFHFTQWGIWAPSGNKILKIGCVGRTKQVGGELLEYCNKVNISREFDGRTWDEFPNHSL